MSVPQYSFFNTCQIWTNLKWSYSNITITIIIRTIIIIITIIITIVATISKSKPYRDNWAILDVLRRLVQYNQFYPNILHNTANDTVAHLVVENVVYNLIDSARRF